MTVLLHRGGTEVGAYHGPGGHLCFAYTGPRTGGGTCLVATGRNGWAFELETAEPGPSVLLVAAQRQTATVRIPVVGGGWFVVHPKPVTGFDVSAAALVTNLRKLQLTGNRAEAFNASQQLLGHTHDCSGLDGPTNCGPWTGLVDARIQPAAAK